MERTLMNRTPDTRSRHFAPGTAGTLLTITLLLAATTAQAQEKAVRSDAVTTKAAGKRTRSPLPQHTLQTASALTDSAAQNGSAAQSLNAPLDRSRLVDFMALSAKRADMRYRSWQIGMENAYREWMQPQGGKVSASKGGQVITNASVTGKQAAMVEKNSATKPVTTPD